MQLTSLYVMLYLNKTLFSESYQVQVIPTRSLDLETLVPSAQVINDPSFGIIYWEGVTLVKELVEPIPSLKSFNDRYRLIPKIEDTKARIQGILNYSTSACVWQTFNHLTL